jgi:hypothetical protein
MPDAAGEAPGTARTGDGSMTIKYPNFDKIKDTSAVKSD